jgi:hypothetical protein
MPQGEGVTMERHVCLVRIRPAGCWVRWGRGEIPGSSLEGFTAGNANPDFPLGCVLQGYATPQPTA